MNIRIAYFDTEDEIENRSDDAHDDNDHGDRIATSEAAFKKPKTTPKKRKATVTRKVQCRKSVKVAGKWNNRFDLAYFIFNCIF